MMGYSETHGIVCGVCGSPCGKDRPGPNPCCREYDDATDTLVSFTVDGREYVVTPPRDREDDTDERKLD